MREAIMAVNRRAVFSIAVLLVLGVFVGIGYWYESRQAAPSQAADAATIVVTSGADRGQGTLREALFIAAAAKGSSTISLRVPTIKLETALPPVVGQGVRIVGGDNPVEIDASALPGGPVLDIATAHVTIQGLSIRNCKASGVLLRASQFRLESATIQACDVGVDVAENATEVLLERNRFVSNRVGVRFAGSNKNASVLKNEFAGHRDAGVWAVRGSPEAGAEAISIRDNRFTSERIGVLAANVAVAVENNDVSNAREAAIQVMGSGAVLRGNRISGGAAMGIVAENAQGTVIEANEIDGVTAYGIMLKNSADALVQGNRVHNSGYGLAFVLGQSPSTALDNTIIEPKFNGIDVIGDSPVLRKNHVMRPRALALKTQDFKAPDGRIVRSQPFLEDNNFDARGLVISASNGSAAPREGQR
jgi:parallel beta-helix repeat protein